MPESAREPGISIDALSELVQEFKERVAALEQRFADAIAILDQAGDNREAALARLREVKG